MASLNLPLKDRADIRRIEAASAIPKAYVQSVVASSAGVLRSAGLRESEIVKFTPSGSLRMSVR
jgi:hypothetical protein